MNEVDLIGTRWCEIVFGKAASCSKPVVLFLLHEFGKPLFQNAPASFLVGVHFGSPKMDEKGMAGTLKALPRFAQGAENGLSPGFAPLKFLGLAWQSEIALLRHEKFRPFRERRSPSGHFLKAGGVDDRLFLSFNR